MKRMWIILALIVLILAACQSSPESLPETAEPISNIPESPTQEAPSTLEEPAGSSPSSTTFEGETLPIDRGNLFSGSGNCVACHNNMVDASGADVSIDRMWRSTMMANAARDPYWQANVRAEVIENPQLREVIEDKCTTCHMPMARTEAASTGAKTSMLDDGTLDPEHPLHSLAIDGISCNTCHQIRPDNFGEPESFSGGFLIDQQLPMGERESFGPFVIQESQATIMQNVSGFIPIQGLHMEESEICATCHTLFTPYLDAEGEIAGEFPEQTIYLEWQNSDYAQNTSCQGCHMPQAEGAVTIATTGGEPRSPFYQHVFVGGNAYMMRVFGQYGPEMNVTAGFDHFSSTLASIQDQLQNRTAVLTLENLVMNEGILHGSLKVENRAGHKFPAGFPSRRAWLHIVVKDTSGEVVFESGAVSQEGAIQGNDNDLDPLLYEPHYQRIETPDQVQIYESMMVNTEGTLTTTLLRGASYIKDNRLLPVGFDLEQATADIASYGAAAEDPDFSGGGDALELNIDLGDAKGPLEITVELLYQSIGYRWAHNLQSYEAPEVARFLEYYQAVPNLPVVVAEAKAQVE